VSGDVVEPGLMEMGLDRASSRLALRSGWGQATACQPEPFAKTAEDGQRTRGRGGRTSNRNATPSGVAFICPFLKTEGYYGTMASMVITDWLTRSMSGCG
jgi:hypothetical protein